MCTCVYLVARKPVYVSVLHAQSPTQKHILQSWLQHKIVRVNIYMCLYIHAVSCVMLRLLQSSGCLLSTGVCLPATESLMKL